MKKMHAHRQKSFISEHSLSLATSAVLLFWLVAYMRSDPGTHWGAFFGNAIADWTGLVFFVIITKYFFEIGSAESRQPTRRSRNPLIRAWQDHSFTIVLIITGAGWVMLNSRLAPASRWGQVVGNIVSEWTQILGTVLLTKKLVERGSKEGN